MNNWFQGCGVNSNLSSVLFKVTNRAFALDIPQIAFLNLKKKCHRNVSLITADCGTQTYLTSSSNHLDCHQAAPLNTHSDRHAHVHIHTASHALVALIRLCLLSGRQLEWTSIKAPSDSMRYMSSYWTPVRTIFYNLFLSACILTSFSVRPSTRVSLQIKPSSFPVSFKGTTSSSSLTVSFFFYSIVIYLTSFIMVMFRCLCEDSRDTCVWWKWRQSTRVVDPVCVSGLHCVTRLSTMTRLAPATSIDLIK